MLCLIRDLHQGITIRKVNDPDKAIVATLTKFEPRSVIVHIKAPADFIVFTNEDVFDEVEIEDGETDWHFRLADKQSVYIKLRESKNPFDIVITVVRNGSRVMFNCGANKEFNIVRNEILEEFTENPRIRRGFRTPRSYKNTQNQLDYF